MRTDPSRSKAVRWLRWLAAACLVLLAVPPAHAQAPAGYSEYYIPGDEDNMGRVLCVYGAATYPCPNPVHTHAVISVTAWSDNTTVYYDHWENGYGFDPANPTTADETYTGATALNTGDRLVFDSALMTLPRWNTYPTPPPSPPATTCNSTATLYRANGTTTVLVNRTAQTTCYDGGDHLYVAGGVVTVTRVGWLDENAARGGTVGVQGTAWEIYPVKPQLTTYVVPFGETSGWHGFQHVAVLIQATRNNTTLTVDLNHDGTPDQLDWNRDGVLDAATSITLQAGPDLPPRRHQRPRRRGQPGGRGDHHRQRHAAGEVHHRRHRRHLHHARLQRVPPGILDEGLLPAARPADERGEREHRLLPLQPEQLPDHRHLAVDHRLGPVHHQRQQRRVVPDRDRGHRPRRLRALPQRKRRLLGRRLQRRGRPERTSGDSACCPPPWSTGSTTSAGPPTAIPPRPLAPRTWGSS